MKFSYLGFYHWLCTATRKETAKRSKVGESPWLVLLCETNIQTYEDCFSFVIERKVETNMNIDHGTEVLELEEVSVGEKGSHDLMVYNDEVNTFDHVIETLIDVCDHTPEQAEQCTLIIHFKGKCVVKMGDFDELVPMRNAICDRGISAEVL